MDNYSYKEDLKAGTVDHTTGISIKPKNTGVPVLSALGLPLNVSFNGGVNRNNTSLLGTNGDSL